MVINLILGVYIPMIRIPYFSGGMSKLPNIGSGMTLAHMTSLLGNLDLEFILFCPTAQTFAKLWVWVDWSSRFPRVLNLLQLEFSRIHRISKLRKFPQTFWRFTNLGVGKEKFATWFVLLADRFGDPTGFPKKNSQVETQWFY